MPYSPYGVDKPGMSLKDEYDEVFLLANFLFVEPNSVAFLL